jgi:glycerol-3-phosphate acyltransferase PlsY
MTDGMPSSLALGALVAYLVGAIPVGFVVARAFGIGDIRRHGSGNIGMTNVLRTAGKVPAVITLVGDVLKGFAAVWLGAQMAGGAPSVAAAATVAAVAGNCWSVFLGFRGGKGVATGFGAILRLAPLPTLPAVLVWITIAATFRYASLASLAAALCVPLGALAMARPIPDVVATACVAAVVVARHRENIARLFAGHERKIGQRSAPA